MNPGLKIKSLYILVGILLLINVATMSFIWYTKIITEQQINPPRPDNNRSFLADELGFTGEQSQKFEVLKQEHRRGVEIILSETKELKDKLFDCIKTGNDSKAKELSGKIAEKQSALEILTYEHFKEVRKVCNDEQKVKFDKILVELIRGLETKSPPPNGAPPPEDRRPPGDRPPPPDGRPPGK
jgi:protein CpxP